MLLTIDVGNTQTVLGLFEGDEVIEHWRINTDPRRTADEIAVVLQGLVQQSPLLVETDISGIALCSTVPSVLHEMREMCRRYYGDVPAVIVEPGVKTGVPVRMDNPKEVGADRVVNALAAVHTHGGPAIVVDFGTATTFDCVSESGDYIGGAIVPGIQISLDALVTSAARLSKVDLVAPKRAIGKNTTHALQSGIVFGYASLVDGLVRRISQEMTRKPRVLATGGLAGLIAEHTASIEEVVPS
ncbi:MAG TPA: type III pantothenate kinase, partial [Vulgatibacteraceae bacterium]|nr:type III pantothenate kinase [Vulgatibacteraceae bacterium]